MSKVSFIILLSFITSGCSAVGNFFVPKHPQSDIRGPDKTCIYEVPKAAPKAFGALATLGASAAIGLLVDRAADAVEDEADRYKASYSARKTFHLFAEKQNKNNLNEMQQSTGEFRVVRWVGEGIKGANGSKESCKNLKNNYDLKEPGKPTNSSDFEKAIEIRFKLKNINESSIWEIVGTTVIISKTKAKIAKPRLWAPWSWWLPLSENSGKIDLSATIVLSGITSEKNGSKTHSDFLKVDLPLEKNIEMDFDNQKVINLEDVTSGYFLIPIPKTGKPLHKGELNKGRPHTPMTISVTIHETDEIGDLIGKGAKKISSNKQQIINFSLEKLGLDAKGGGDGNNSNGETKSDDPS